MKKLAILSPLVLLATTALAQDSTCILQPSCSQLGYTSAEADCGTAKVLRCPFDVSQVACLSGGSDSGGSGAGGDDYNPYDPNNELGDVIAVKINMTAAGSATFTYGGGNIFVDCGEGTIVGGSAGSSGTVSCTYTAAGTYTVKLSGDFTYYGGSNPEAASLIKLDKSGITKMSEVCGSSTNGVVPPLPSTLVDGTSMFSNCSGINSPYPKLPATLEVADMMFWCHPNTLNKFSGTVELPVSLKSAKSMFAYNKGLQSVTGLENTQITDGTSMFYSCTGLTGSIPALPETLTNGDGMFFGCGLTSVPTLPSGLTNGTQMFYSCTGLTGSIPALPSGLTIGRYMFANCKGLTGSIPALPSTLSNADYMFYDSSNQMKLSGKSPKKPAGLTNYSYTFKGTKVTNDGSWPSTAF